jgi:hypothetical protein
VLVVGFSLQLFLHTVVGGGVLVVVGFPVRLVQQSLERFLYAA